MSWLSRGFVGHGYVLLESAAAQNDAAACSMVSVERSIEDERRTGAGKCSWFEGAEKPCGGRIRISGGSFAARGEELCGAAQRWGARVMTK